MTAATTELDPFDSAPEQGDFIKFKHLGASAPNRLVIVIPLSKGKDKSKRAPFDMYDYVNCVVIPCDGATDERVPVVGKEAAAAPFEMRLSGAAVIKGLLARLSKNERDGRVGTPFVARMDGKPAKDNDDVTVWGFVDASRDDNMAARPVYAEYLKHKTATEPDPFA